MLDDYRIEYAQFNSAWMLEHYLHMSGQKSELELTPIYDRYDGLFSRESIAALQQHLADLPEHFEDDGRALEHLLLFAIEHFQDNAAKELTEAISRFESEATVEWRSRKLTFQDCAVAIRTERDRGSRRSIHQRREELIEASNELRAARISKLHETVRALGFASYVALYEGFRKLDYRVLSREASSVIEGTQHAYGRRLGESLKRDLGIGIEEADRSDALFFLHLSDYDQHFPATQLLRTYERTMDGLGIRTGEQNNVQIDAEPRARKSARAFCAPISIPDDVRLVFRSMGGQSDYQALLHESGHTQHYAWTSPGLRPEFKITGDYALTETYAFLFNHLVMDRHWLATMLDFRDSSDFILSATLSRLVTVRRYAAKLSYECELHGGGDFGRASALYGELQTDATGFATGPAEFLFDVDDGFYSANYLRAWAFEVALREHLRSRFGAAWWTSRRAGSFLRELWETGERYSADEMAGQIGIGPISFDMLIDEFNQALK